MNMTPEFLKVSSCLKCQSRLTATSTTYNCAECGTSYPIKENVARFVSSEDYSASFGFQWNIHAKTQLDKFNGLSISRDRLFRESQWKSEDLKDKLVLECGSGAGRFTEVLCRSGARVFSIDYSIAVEANKKNNAEFENLFLAQASIYELPFAAATFDYLICIGVIQHTPDVEKTTKCMLNMLKPGGYFCFDAYASPISYLHPRHLLRPWTKKMPKERLYKTISSWVPRLLPISTFLHKIPLIGQLVARLIPIANWRANIQLPTESMYKDWAILDTFDWYSPAYEYPQSRRRLANTLRACGIQEFEIVRERGLFIARGRKPN